MNPQSPILVLWWFWLTILSLFFIIELVEAKTLFVLLFVTVVYKIFCLYESVNYDDL